MKVAIVGDKFVGKSSAAAAFCHETFDKRYSPTPTINIHETSLSSDRANEPHLKVQFWECGADHLDNNVKQRLYQGAQCVLILYDITNYQSFLSATQHWYHEAKRLADSDVFIIIIGCKVDLVKARKVNIKEIEHFANQEEIFFMEISSQDKTNIHLTLSILKIRATLGNTVLSSSNIKPAPSFAEASHNSVMDNNVNGIPVASVELNSTSNDLELLTQPSSRNVIDLLNTSSMSSRNLLPPSQMPEHPSKVTQRVIESPKFKSPRHEMFELNKNNNDSPGLTINSLLSRPSQLNQSELSRYQPPDEEPPRRELPVATPQHATTDMSSQSLVNTSVLSQEYEDLKRLFSAKIGGDLPVPQQPEEHFSRDVMSLPSGHGPATLRVHRSGSIDITANMSDLHLGHSEQRQRQKQKTQPTANGNRIKSPGRRTKRAVVSNGNNNSHSTGHNTSRSKARSRHQPDIIRRNIQNVSSSRRQHRKPPPSSPLDYVEEREMDELRELADEAAVPKLCFLPDDLTLHAKPTYSWQRKVRANNLPDASESSKPKTRETMMQPWNRPSPAVSERSSSSSHQARSQSYSAPPDLIVDVNVGSGLVKPIEVRRGDDPAQLASQFVRMNHLSQHQTARLAEMLAQRIRAYFNEEHDQDIKFTKGVAPKLHTHSRVQSSSRRELGKLRVQVGRGKIGVIVVREGDNPAELAESFRRTYGLRHDSAKQIEDSIVQQMQLQHAEISTSQRGTLHPHYHYHTPQPASPSKQFHHQEHREMLGGDETTLTPAQEMLLRKTLAGTPHQTLHQPQSEFESLFDSMKHQLGSGSAPPPPPEDYARQQVVTNLHFEATPPPPRRDPRGEALFNLDVDIGNNKTERIVVHQHDDLERLAESFVMQHGLQKSKISRLKFLLEKNKSNAVTS